MKKILLSLLVICTIVPFCISQNLPSNIVGQYLPYTWEAPMPNGKMINTLETDGTITSIMMTGCINCGGTGRCGLCYGSGGQYWYEIGFMPCGACGGAGQCRACGGKGYSVMRTITRSGLTIGYDEHGNCYVAGNGIDSGSRNSTNRCSHCNGTGYYHCVCKNVPNFGQTLNHQCPECGEVHRSGASHMCTCRRCGGTGRK